MTTAYQTTETIEQLQARFITERTDQYRYAYGKTMPDTEPALTEATGGYDQRRTIATLGELRTSLRPDLSWHMRDWLNETDEEPGEWDDDWQRQYDLYTR
jgi:hypothetical protein